MNAPAAPAAAASAATITAPAASVAALTAPAAFTVEATLVAPYSDALRNGIAFAASVHVSLTDMVLRTVIANALAFPADTAAQIVANVKLDVPMIKEKGSWSAIASLAFKTISAGENLANVRRDYVGAEMSAMSAADFAACVDASFVAFKATYNAIKNPSKAGAVASHTAGAPAAATDTAAPVALTGLDMVEMVQSALSELRAMAAAGDVDAVNGLAMVAASFAPAAEGKAKKAA